jgi:hypothetical protein
MSVTYHVIAVQERRPSCAPRFDCAPWCDGPEPHVHQFQANRVRPTAKQTATFRALDAQPPRT